MEQIYTIYTDSEWLIHSFVNEPCSFFLSLLVPPPDPDTVWHTLSGAMQCSGEPVDPHTVLTQPRNIPPVVLSLQSMNTYLLYMPGKNLDFFLSPCWPISGFFHFLSPSENMWHQSLFFLFFLARLSHFNPSSCETERKEGRKKDGSVSEEAHSSWRSLITVMTERNRKMKDMRAGAQQQRWQESLCRDEMNQPIQRPEFCCWYEAATSLPEGLWVSKAATFWSKERRRECARLWPLNKIMDCALNYCQSSSSQGPRISHEDNKVMGQ